jgi:hypothetical protein
VLLGHKKLETTALYAQPKFDIRFCNFPPNQ